MYKNATGAYKHPMRFYSTVEFPLICGSLCELIMDRVSPPQLHLFTGITNHMLEALNNAWGTTNLLFNWLAARNMHRGQFAFNGPQCNRFLETLLPDLKEIIPLDLMKYIKAFEAFKVVRDSCFSHYLHPNLRQIISEFEKAYFSTGMEDFPKLHILCRHVPDFCEKNNIGMAIFF